MTDHFDKEEQYLLRVHDKPLAAKLRHLLTDPAQGSKEAAQSLDLRFDSQGGADTEARTGLLRLGGKEYPVKRQDLPTIVESFKTYDKISLVKTADVGQVIVVPEKGAALPEGREARNGVTPPMKDARKRRFRKSRAVDPNLMRQVEDLALVIASGQAPEGYEFIDEEEEYIVSEDGLRGSWKPFQPRADAQTPDLKGKRGPKSRGKRKGESMKPGLSQDDTQLEIEAQTPEPPPSQSQDVEDI